MTLTRAQRSDVGNGWRPRGTNQSGMRDSNERLVLSLVRRHGSLAKSDIARMTGLSAQTVSVIMRELETEELLVRREPQRGRVGQPSVPMSLDPDGAFFLGLKIGRRSADLVLVDFLGRTRAMRSRSYRYPQPTDTVSFVEASLAAMLQDLPAAHAERIAGLGIAMPFELWNWADSIGLPADTMDAWRHADIRADIAGRVAFPVYLENDATAACSAELVFGEIGDLRHFIYFYVGSFVGGGIVLNGQLYPGPSGNAGAVGSMPVPGADGRPRQLIDVASIATLERAIGSRGKDSSLLWTSPEDWGELGPDLPAWIESAAAGLAYAIVAASSVVDFEAAIIEGWMPLDVRRRLVEAVRANIGAFDVEGIKVPELREGRVGLHARALGGASLPLTDRFLAGQGSFAKGG